MDIEDYSPRSKVITEISIVIKKKKNVRSEIVIKEIFPSLINIQ